MTDLNMLRSAETRHASALRYYPESPEVSRLEWIVASMKAEMTPQQAEEYRVSKLYVESEEDKLKRVRAEYEQMASNRDSNSI